MTTRYLLSFFLLFSLNGMVKGQNGDAKENEYRTQSFEAFPTTQEVARKLKTSEYNPFENPTGIWFSQGEDVVLTVNDTQGETPYLCTYDYEREESLKRYPLKNGKNKIKIEEGGLGYLLFYTSRWASIQPIVVTFEGGQVNGYFDRRKHTDTYWKQLLAEAVCDRMDIKGDYINLAYKVSSLKQYCPEKGSALIDYYDRVVDIEHELMGLKRYNLRPRNHMFAREVSSGLFADGWGAGFASDCMHELANPDNIHNGLWCIAHELGHVNQIRPGLKWVSTTEVTNNIYSVWCRYLLDPSYMNLEHERVNDGDNNHVLGGRFNAYLNYGIVKGEQWLCQRGQDKMEGYENGGDHFVKLCPLWQLQLYYAVAGHGNSWNCPDWFADIAQIVRNTEEDKLSNGELQLNFMKNVSDVVKEDLSDFFIKAGMLKPIDKDMDDYTRAQLTITQKQCDGLKRYMAKYPKPASPVIYYLTANSIQAYREKLPVIGIYNKGVKQEKGTVIIDHNVWKNSTVFETYRGDELITVAMVGTDSPERDYTLVRYPEGSTRIEAVAWDGTRTLVYGER